MEINGAGVVTGVFIGVAINLIKDGIKYIYSRNKAPTNTNTLFEKTITESIKELKTEITELRTELKDEINSVRQEVKDWANKLLEFYAKKSELDRANDKIEIAKNDITEVRTDVRALRSQVSEIIDRFNKHIEKH